eukprot:4217753-Prymnesium_polylepis.1
MDAPVFYDADELEEALGFPDADESDDESEHGSMPSLVGSPHDTDDEDDGSARDVVGWVEPGDEGDVRRHTPSYSQWWFIESPDSGYLATSACCPVPITWTLTLLITHSWHLDALRLQS